MSGRRIVELLHKRTRQIYSLLAFGKRWFLSLLSIKFYFSIVKFSSQGRILQQLYLASTILKQLAKMAR
jgi:hypothetical protein